MLAQTHESFELILVDDGSPDQCGKICDYYETIDSRIKVIHQNNQGTGAARNSGLAVATGKYVYFCDPDDYVEPTLLADNFALAEKYEANMVIFAYYDELCTKSDQKSIPRTVHTIFLERQSDFRIEFEKLYRKKIMFTLWNKLYKKDFLDQNHCRFGNQKVGQDTIFNYIVYENLDRVYVHDQKYYHHVIDRKDSATNLYRENRFQIRYEETSKFETLIRKWGYEEKCRQLIVNDWIETLSHGMNNLFYEGSPLNDYEKKRQVMLFLNTPKMKHVLRDSSVKDGYGLFMKIELFLLKNNHIPFALYLVKLRMSVKKYALTFFSFSS